MAHTDRTLPSGWRRGARYVGPILAVLGVFFVVRTLVDSSVDYAVIMGRLSLTDLWIPFLMALASMTLIGIGWGLFLRRGTGTPTYPDILRWYFSGQLGKYIPGGFWPIIGRAELAKRDGLPRQAGYISTLRSLLATYGGAAIVGSSAIAVRSGSWLWSIGAGLMWLLAIGSTVVPQGIAIQRRVFNRLTRSEDASAQPVTLTLLMYHTVPWVVGGLAVSLIASSLQVESADAVTLIGAHTAGWLIGFLAIGVPGGVGVREAAFVSLAGTALTPATAAIVAVTARVIFVLADVTGAIAMQVYRLFESRKL